MNFFGSCLHLFSEKSQEFSINLRMFVYSLMN